MTSLQTHPIPWRLLHRPLSWIRSLILNRSATALRFGLLLGCLYPNAGVFAQDWANLKEYQAANQALSPPAEGEDRIVFMGNSITIGWLHSMPEFFEGKPYINRGISGQTTPQMLLRFRQDVIDLQPSVVVILAGTNDVAGNTGPISLDQIMDNLKSMTELALANGVEPVLCSVLPAYDYPWRPGLHPNVKIPKLNAMIENYTRFKNLVYLDYFSEMADSRNGLDKTLATDEVHPTLKGYRMMAPLAEAAIARALDKKSRR